MSKAPNPNGSIVAGAIVTSRIAAGDIVTTGTDPHHECGKGYAVPPDAVPPDAVPPDDAPDAPTAVNSPSVILDPVILDSAATAFKAATEQLEEFNRQAAAPLSREQLSRTVMCYVDVLELVQGYYLEHQNWARHGGKVSCYCLLCDQARSLGIGFEETPTPPCTKL